MDHIKDLNSPPTTINETGDTDDPLGPFREFCLTYAAGNLPIEESYYLILAGGRIAALAKPDSTAPRPVVIVDIFRRLGMAAMIRACKDSLGAHFGTRGEYGVGIQAPGQILSWTMKLYQEQDPSSTQLWSDLTNGFNAIHRIAIENGLKNFPTNLQWLRKSFHAFYSGASTLQYPQRLQDSFKVVDITSEGGIFQGDSASGIFFSAGLQSAFDTLRSEYPEAVLLKYLDDLNGSIRVNKMVKVSEPRAKAKIGAYNDELQVPISVAILKRWEYLALTECGLEASPKKRGVVSLQTPLQNHTQFNINVKEGLKVAGVPIGCDSFVLNELQIGVKENVKNAFEAVEQIPDLQYQHLLNVNCGGNARAQHLWQTVRPDLTTQAVNSVDNLTKVAIGHMLPKNAFEYEHVENQCFRPLRYGGLGYKKANNVSEAAYIGGFALAAFGPFGIGEIDGDLLNAIMNPENHYNSILQFPSMMALHSAWKRQTNNDRATALCKAAVADCLGPPREAEESDEEYSFRCAKTRNQDNIAFEKAWKLQNIKGTDSTITTESITTTLLETSNTEWQNKLFFENLSALEIDRFNNPGMHPSIIGDLWACGERKLQRLLSRTNEMQETSLHLRQNRTPLQQARIRGKLNKLANVPLQATPSTPQTRFSNEEWKATLNDRLQLPMVLGLNIQHQTCQCKATIGDGRHFRRCKISNGMMKLHDDIRDVTLQMVRNAGLTATAEQRGLLPDNNSERPADIFIINWEIKTGCKTQKDLRIFSKHAIDLSFPLVDSYTNGCTKDICNKVGIVANKKTLTKLNKIGTTRERTQRGNSLTMKQRCADQDINYWPIPVEGDGQPSTSFEAFLNKVCDSATNVGHNPLCFKKRWTTILACALAKNSAQMVLRRTSAEFKRLSRIPESNLEIMCHPSSIIPDLIGSDHNNFYHRFSSAYKASKKSYNRLRARKN
jgi:hypothetical protein